MRSDYKKDQPPEVPTPIIGPGICEEVYESFKVGSVVADLDPLTFFPQDTSEDAEKLEGRCEGWYKLLDQLSTLKSDPRCSLGSGYSRHGELFIRIEQYMLALATGASPEFIAHCWADVAAAQQDSTAEPLQVTMELTQLELGESRFSLKLGQAGAEPEYSTQGSLSQVLRHGNRAYVARRWVLTGVKVILLTGSPLAFEKDEGIQPAIARLIEAQQDELYLEHQANSI